MNDEQDVRRLLEAAVRHEPPLTLDRDAVLDEGRRRLRVRRTATVGGAAMAVVAVVIGMTALSGANLGGPDEIGPAISPAPVSETAAAPSSTTTTSPGPSTTQVPPPLVTTTTSAPTTSLVDLGGVLRTAPVAWPDDVRKEGNGSDWFVFEDGQADFHLVALDGSRRMVQVVVASEGIVLQPPCPDDTCRTHVEADGTKVFISSGPIEEPGSVVRTVIAHRPSGTHVQVMDTTGFGPPWRAEPVLDEALMVALATLPGFDRVNR